MKVILHSFFIFLSFNFFLTVNGLAQEDIGGESRDSAPAILESIDIRGTIRRDELKSTSATVLTQEEIGDRIFYQPLDLVNLSPGVSVIQYGEAGLSAQFQVRGFMYHHENSIYLDGIPLHDNGHNVGFTDSTVIIPIEIESVEIIKGPSSVYYGARSVGGTIAAQSLKGGNFTRLDFRYGSWNEMDATGLIARQNDKLAQVYAFEMFHSDGYRGNSDWDRKIFSGRWTYNFSDKFQASFNIRAYDSEWDSAGYVSKKRDSTRAWVDDGSGTGNGGYRKRYDARFWANYLINDKTQVTYYLYGTTMDFTRYQRAGRSISNVLDNSFPRMTEQYNRHQQWGTGLTYNWKGELAGKEASFVAGSSYTKEFEDPRKTWSIPWGSGRHRVEPPVTNNSFNLENPAILSEFSYQILRQINVRLGARYDWLRGQHTNNLTGVRTSADYKFFSPKAGVIYSPLENLDIFTNYGRGFTFPGGPNSFNTVLFNDDNNLKLAKSNQIEIGFRYFPIDWVGLEATFYNLKTSNDGYNDPITTDYVQTGETTREGVELSVTAKPRKDWRLTANYSYMEAKYDNFFSGQQDLAGYRLPWTPRKIANFEIAYAPETGFGARVTLRWEADMLYQDAPLKLRNGQPNLDANGFQIKPFRAPDKTFLDAQISYRFNENIRLLFDVKNIIGKAYEGYAYGKNWGTGDYMTNYSNPRAFYLSLQMNWDHKNSEK
jgi:iron complex outermembrane receptor protein